MSSVILGSSAAKLTTLNPKTITSPMICTNRIVALSYVENVKSADPPDAIHSHSRTPRQKVARDCLPAMMSRPCRPCPSSATQSDLRQSGPFGLVGEDRSSYTTEQRASVSWLTVTTHPSFCRRSGTADWGVVFFSPDSAARLYMSPYPSPSSAPALFGSTDRLREKPGSR